MRYTSALESEMLFRVGALTECQLGNVFETEQHARILMQNMNRPLGAIGLGLSDYIIGNTQRLIEIRKVFLDSLSSRFYTPALTVGLRSVIALSEVSKHEVELAEEQYP